MADIFVEFFNTAVFIGLSLLSIILFTIGWKLWKNRHVTFSGNDYFITMVFNKKINKIVFKKILTKDAVHKLLK